MGLWREKFRLSVDAYFFSGITALTAFNWNAKGVNGGLSRDKGVNGVLLES